MEIQGLLVMVLIVGFLAIGAVAWNGVFGSAHATLMPANNSTYYGNAQLTDTTTLTFGAILPYMLLILGALAFVGFLFYFAKGAF